MRELKETYALLPATRCRRKAYCCSMLPEMTLVEALPIIQRLVDMAPAMRRRLLQKIISYFFLNPVEITSCPFLEGQDCLIYADRFFGCRSYGLWSQAYYEKLAASDRKAKIYLQKQWKNLDVSLPKKVIDFQVPYCRRVKTNDHAFIDDKTLLHVSDTIESISTRFSQCHQSFLQKYFCDLSFLLAALVFGHTTAVQIKFNVVYDIVNAGNRKRLDSIIEDLPDLFAELT
jgi:hypothetical protein